MSKYIYIGSACGIVALTATLLGFNNTLIGILSALIGNFVGRGIYDLVNWWRGK